MEKFPSVVADIMSSPVVTIDGEKVVRDAALLMAERRIGSIIVMERGQPVGIVTERDMLERVVSQCRDPCNTRMREIMSTPLITIPREMGILEAMKKMIEHNISRLVVMKGDALLGIVSERDVVRAVSLASLTSFSSLLRRRG